MKNSSTWLLGLFYLLAPRSLIAEAMFDPGSANFFDPKVDMVAFNSQFKSENKKAKAILDRMDSKILELERKGIDVSCVSQRAREIRWSNSYRASTAGIHYKLLELGETLIGKRGVPNATLQSSVDGSWGECHEEWFFKLDVSSDALDVLAEEKKAPTYKTTFFDRINSPERLRTYLDSILISDVRLTGKDNRKELNYSVSAFLRTIGRHRPSNYIFHADLEKTLKDFIVKKWQNRQTGYWGAWYLHDGKVFKNDDLSITFHIVSYLKGNVPYLGKIAWTTYLNRSKPYPFGLQEDGDYANHHNYDAVRLFRYGWSELSKSQKSLISKDIQSWVDWTLSKSLQTDGSFLISSSDESLGDAYYFGVSFLDEVGFFESNERFWTTQNFPDAVSIREKIQRSLLNLPNKNYLAVNALKKLRAKD